MHQLQLSCTGDGSKAVAKRKLQQPKLPFNKQQREQPSEGQAETSGSNEPEAASPIVVPKVTATTKQSTMSYLDCMLCDMFSITTFTPQYVVWRIWKSLSQNLCSTSLVHTGSDY